MIATLLWAGRACSGLLQMRWLLAIKSYVSMAAIDIIQATDIEGLARGERGGIVGSPHTVDGEF